MTTENGSAHGALTLPDVAAFAFDGAGKARSVNLEELSAIKPGDNTSGFTWVHLRRDHQEVASWLKQFGLDDLVIDALTAEETRPRCTIHGDGALLNLRGVNLNPGEEPQDMISVRLWIEEKKVVGVWLRPLMAVRDLFDSIDRQRAPVSPGDLVAKLALRLADRAEPTVTCLNERLDALEEAIIDEAEVSTRLELAYARRAAIVLRRFLFPQRDALTTLQIEELHWLGSRDRSRLQEAAERVTRLAEELDAIRDRAQVVHDQIMEKRADTMNRHMLVLSVVAALFLPLGFLTGLLGVNLGGIPGTGEPWAFVILCVLLLALGALEYWVFRRLKWI
ncbi:MAG: zinc transporter ZntB [Alphaproteobacteria bacterium]|nr:zinc transporter ZntB [Alphaproteobacteria bacterium]